MSSEWFSMYPGMMVLICVPLSRRSMQLSPVTLTLARFSILYHWLKGSGFKKGVCAHHFMPWVSHPGAPLAWLSFLEELSLPSLVPSPWSKLKVHLPSFLPALGNCRLSGLGYHSDNNASPSVEYLSPLSFTYNELFCHAFDVIQVLTINAFLLIGALLSICTEGVMAS